MSLSDDGNRAYIADPTGGNMLILDTSEIQARKPNPQAREISRLTWNAASIPQNAIPFTDDGKPYVLEFDEYTQATTRRAATPTTVGAARIIDISDETPAARRLQPAPAGQPAGRPRGRERRPRRAAARSQGYAAHYCNIPTRGRPEDRRVLVHRLRACASSTSATSLHPKEIAYFVAPTKPRAENGFDGQRLRDVAAGVRARAARDLVHATAPPASTPCAWPRASGPARTRAPAGAGKKGCLSVGRRIRHQGIGKVRLGMTRKALLRRLPAPRHKKKRAWRWCVRGGGKVTAAFTKRGRVALVSTTARVPLKRARLRAFRHPRSLGHGLVRPFRGSHRLFTVRRGKVRAVSIASSRTIKQRALLRRYLRAASSA